jgi:ribose transport system substrate-binding protein
VTTTGGLNKVRGIQKLATTICVAAAVAGLAACGSGSNSGGGSGSVKGKVIGLSMHFLADDYSKAFADTVKKTAAAQGVKVRVDNAGGDAGKQLSDIQSLTTQRVDALIVIPIDESAVVPAVKTATRAKIPVLSASPIPAVNSDLTAIVGPSDYGNGKAACEEMAKKINSPGAEVAISTASVKLYRIEQRVKGCQDALKAANLKVVATTAGLSPEEGLQNAQNLLSGHPKLRGIFASFSNLVLGAGNAVKAAGRKNVAVSGIDADRAIIKQISKGTVNDVAAQFPIEQAKLITKAAISVLQGGKISHDQENQLPTRTVDAINYKQRYQEIWGEPFPTS